MTAQELRDTIKEFKEILAREDTDADERRMFGVGLEKAQKALKDLEDAEKAKPAPKAKTEEPKAKEAKEAKAAPKPKAEVSDAKARAKEALDKCKELLAKYEGKKKVDRKRVEKRKKAGKPAELTPAETVKKSAESVKAKVVDIKEKDEFLKKSEVNSLVSGIVQTVKNTLKGIETKKDKVEFLTKLYASIADLEADTRKELVLFGLVAEKGILVKDGPGVKDKVLQWMSLNRDKLETYTDTEFLINLMEIINHFPHAVGVMRFGGKLPVIEFTVQYQGKRTKVLATSAQEAREKGAPRLGAPSARDVSAIPSAYDIYADMYTYHPEPEMAMARGGRTLAAINKDRKYRSDEPWEKDYKRKSTPTNPRYRRLEEGGETEESENAEMLMNQAQSLRHHSEELVAILSEDTEVEPWVITKAQRAVTDLADITHYLEGERHKERKGYAHGGQMDLFKGEYKAEGGELNWRNAQLGDNALVKAENRLGVIVQSYGRKFHLKFVDGTMKTYDAADLKFIPNDDDDDDFRAGGQLDEEGDPYGTFEMMKKGGQVMVDVINEGEKFDADRYKGIFGDYDDDGVVNADDHDPLNPSDRDRVDSPGVSNPMTYLIDLKGRMDSNMYSFIDDLKDFAPDGSKIYARTKTPYSILNKLVMKRLMDRQHGLKDLIGTTIVVSDRKELEAVRDKMESGGMGEVIGFDDYYEDPKDGYRAYHFNVLYKGLTVEVQVKTKRQKAINELSHEPYKQNRLDGVKLERMSRLADQADRGDKDAIREFNEFISQPNPERAFYKQQDGMMAEGGMTEDKYQVVNKDGRYYAASMSTYKPAFHASPFMGYLYTMAEAMTLRNRLEKQGYEGLRIVKYESKFFDDDGGMMARGGIMYPDLSYGSEMSDGGMTQNRVIKDIKGNVLGEILKSGKRFKDGKKVSLVLSVSGNYGVLTGKWIYPYKTLTDAEHDYKYLTTGIGKGIIFEMAEGGMMAKGGKTSFKELADAIAAKYEGKAVKSAYQKKYGKRYSKEEAKEAGKAIAATIERRKGRM